MARRKGASKTKASAKKIALQDNSQAVKDTHQLKDDPGGGGRDTVGNAQRTSKSIGHTTNSFLLEHNTVPVMQSSWNRMGADVAYQQNIQEKLGHTSSTIYNNNSNNSSDSISDLKYLHKKFKRIASAAIGDNKVQTNADANPSAKMTVSQSVRNSSGGQVQDVLPSKQNSQSTSNELLYDGTSLKSVSSEAEMSSKLFQYKFSNGESYLGEQIETAVMTPKVIYQHSENFYQPPKQRNYQQITQDQSQLHALNMGSSNADLHSVDHKFTVSNSRGNDSDINFTCDYPKDNKLSANILSDKMQMQQQQEQEQQSMFHANNIKNNNNKKNVPISTTRMASMSPLNLQTNHQYHNHHHHQNEQQLGFTQLPAIQTSQFNSSSAYQEYLQDTYPNQIAQTESATKAFQQSTSNDSRNNNTGSAGSNAPGRYACPFCQLNCTKPSVLRKHIRAHTNERPYPCGTCGFAFKTRSNLYKHYRSRSHAMKLHCTNAPALNDSQFDMDFEVSQSAGSDHELSSCSTTTSSDVISRPTSPFDEQMSISPASGNLLNCPTSTQAQSAMCGMQSQPLVSQEKPYKPKFHKAALYHSNDSGNDSNTAAVLKNSNHSRDRATSESGLLSNKSKSATASQSTTTLSHHPLSTQNVEYLKEHISKIISQNEAIMEGVEPALQKKYHKITGISRGNSINGSGTSNAGETASAMLLSSISLSSSSSSPATTKQYQNLHQARDEASIKPIKIEDKTETSSTQPMTNARNFPTLQQQAQQVLQAEQLSEKHRQMNRPTVSPQPLNLTADTINETSRKRSLANNIFANVTVAPMVPITQPLQIETSCVTSSSVHQNHHPQNPERSIIKSLLLNSRGLAVPTTGEGEDAVYTCPLCKISFRSADNLQYHTKCYCQGTPAISLQNKQSSSPQSAPISPVGSPSHKYFRSNSFNLCLPEKYSPNTLAKLASSSLRHHRTPLSLAKLAAQQTVGHFLSKSSAVALATSMGASTNIIGGRNRPDNIVINTETCPAPVPIGNAAAQSVSSQCVQITKQLIDASLPSPGPLLGKTRLVDTYNMSSDSRKTDDAVISNVLNKSTATSSKLESSILVVHSSTSEMPSNSSSSKRKKTNSYVPTPISQINYSPITPNESLTSPKNPRLLQMCGGEIRIVARKEESAPRFGSSGGSIISISPSPDSLPDASPMSIRTGLLSGGSIIELSPSKGISSSSSNASSPPAAQNSDHLLSQHLLPPISHAASHLSSKKHIIGNYFQFPPPINSITAYNPLTLPPSQSQLSSDVPTALNPIEATTILHGGKLIPFVPGIPGPNSLSVMGHLPSPGHLHSPKSDSIRSPSPKIKKIIPNSPLAIRAPVSQKVNLGLLSPPSSNVSGTKNSKSARASPKIKPVPLSKITATITKDESQHTVKSAFSGVINGLTSNVNHSLPFANFQQPIWSPIQLSAKNQNSNKKPFNFSRIADNLSPSKPTAIETENLVRTSDDTIEVRHFNFENLIPNPEIIVRPKQHVPIGGVSPLEIDVTSTTSSSPALSISTSIPTVILPAKITEIVISDAMCQIGEPSSESPKKSAKTTKFLRPSSLPLKPGTFTPKRHHGITPTANTLPLISPETPRPSKHCVQLYLNGHAYTYLGLKCSTKTFYCTVNRPQPVHFTNQHKLSIYSNWQTCAENNPHPLGLSPKEAMSLYDSRQQQQQCRSSGKYTVANSFTKFTTLHSQSLICTPFDNQAEKNPNSHSLMPCDLNKMKMLETVKEDTSVNVEEKLGNECYLESLQETRPSEKKSNFESEHITSVSPTPSTSVLTQAAARMVPGGYESNEDYTYVRGRGRGRYVCSKCGIRCRKPSMLEKHIRTHTDVRPYTCQHCAFSFKTKGNLTKHMKSKAHYKKCVELGLNPLLSAIDEDYTVEDDQEDSSMTSSGGERTSILADGYDDADSDEMSDGDDLDNESSDNEDCKRRLPEHEAAHCLLSLSQTSPSYQNSIPSPNLLIPHQPMTYPYVGGTSAKSLDLIPNDFISQRSRSANLISSTSSQSVFSLDKAVPRANLNLAMHSPMTIDPEASGAYMQPIDLTKPRNDRPSEEKNMYSRVATPITQTTPTYAGTAGLLSSLMTLSDKVPSLPSPLTASTDGFPLVQNAETRLDQKPNCVNGILMQTYLTERALQKSKIKLSQMTRNMSNLMTVNAFEATTPRNTVEIDPKAESAKNSIYYPKQIEFQGNVSSIRDYRKNEIEITRASRHSFDDSPIKTQNIERKISLPQITGHAKQKSVDTTLCVSSIADKPTADITISKAYRYHHECENVLKSSEMQRLSTLTKGLPVVATALDVPTFRIQMSPVSSQTPLECIDDQSGMDTLAEIAASSVKLDTTKPPVPSISASKQSTQVPIIANESPIDKKTPEKLLQLDQGAWKESSAKNIASEYLKMTTAEHEKDDLIPLVPNNMDDSSGTSDLDVSESNTKKIGNTSSVSLGSERGSPATATAIISARTVVVGEDGFKSKSSKANDLPVVALPRGRSASAAARANAAFIQEDGGRSVCSICSKVFLKEHQMVLHMNIHYMNPRKFRCEPCGVNFHTQPRLQKHERSETHKTKVLMTTTFGQVTTKNPRPFECSDCKIAFRIHGHLAKHLRSKTHVQKLECLQKLPFGTYAEIERAGISLTDIDTTDCDNSLASLKVLAQKLLQDKDPNEKSNIPMSNFNCDRTESNSEDGEPIGSPTHFNPSVKTTSLSGSQGALFDKDNIVELPSSAAFSAVAENSDNNSQVKSCASKRRKLNEDCENHVKIGESNES